MFSRLIERQRNHELMLQSTKVTELPPLKKAEEANVLENQLHVVQEQTEDLNITVAATSRKRKKGVTFKNSEYGKEKAGNDNSEISS